MNNKKITLSTHTATLKHSKVYHCCKRLFANTGVKYFCYLRRYKDGRMTFLPSEIDIGNYLFEDGFYPHMWIVGIPFDEFKSGLTYWDIAEKCVSLEEARNIAQQLSHLFKLSKGIEIIEKTETYCDFYSFSGFEPRLYYTPINYLYQFIYYFRESCQSLIQDVQQDTFQVCEPTIQLAPIPIIDIHLNKTQGLEDFNVKRYYLDGEYAGIYLTKREVDILKGLELGVSTKELADSLFISARTVEHHVTNIKDKLKLSRTTEILHIARLKKII